MRSGIYIGIEAPGIVRLKLVVEILAAVSSKQSQ